MDTKNYEQKYNDYKKESKEQANVVTNTENNGKDVIKAVKKNDDGDIIAFRMESGRDLDYVTALNEAKEGKIAHIDVFHKYGRDIIRSEPDGIKENNLDNLPTF
ncbi:Protein of unknown function (DUF3892) [Schinkia azotoformans MEV2011]|uniref:DUF3892 domain-containing protein n=1 Tax=Schinkia azotoformans MEV2011 TaxID=1348973 RepID=A0A072NTX3_SCHAZ|nr:DUF3892 domain-containing protein [Schinkia azotoformans]KEF40348.1 Protein of unknown function (DUF3892) [Schinkia azotoformans MEV2011]MEC1696236.1 DUF3892 domain-containing protein [Schinkia azotoformans]MEC1716548.1 DUF3892 domain-containing protein [Schinkia azotoformans]MEC1725260.1 DUF3892 domain-containing protein [Schinkia azotoformans]MEC1739386.1 DUF3892 domain-containing protein [Schinkia azotoformans]